jgi:hypothetical protein
MPGVNYAVCEISENGGVRDIQQVFYSNSIKNGWDGTFIDVPQESGAYFYYIVMISPERAMLFTKEICPGDMNGACSKGKARSCSGLC